VSFDVFVRRPVFTLVLSLLVVLFGLVSLVLLPVRETPAVQAPIVTVNTTYFGADPSIMETEVTEVLERELNGIEGVKVITSTSSEQTSSITVEFVLERDLEAAANDVRSRVAKARRNLPDDVEEPVVEKSEADASPVLFVRMDADDESILELSEVADTLVRERLQNVQGVSSVQIYGEQVWAIRIELEPARLAARGLTVDDVEAALRANNVSSPAGRVEGGATEMTVRLEGDLRSAREFENLVVTSQNGAMVRLGDLGNIRVGAENERTAARADGQPTVTVAVLPQSNANIIDISDEVARRLPGIQEDLPDGVSIEVSYDRSQSVRASIREVEETLIIAFALVVLVIFAFLRDWRSTLVPAAAVPVSLVGTLTFLWLAGFTINVFTLFGLVLAIGIVVDDAIVVLENVYRRMEEGEDVWTASVEGTRQIAFAVIATTLSLVAVFLPVIFTGGTTGRLFLEFGATVAVSVLISGFVALTLTPMLCSRLLKRHEGERGAFFRVTGRLLDGLNNAFDTTLGAVIRFPVLALGLVAVVVVVGAVAYDRVPREFFPIEDRNLVFVRTLAPEGTSFAYMDARMKELEPDLMEAAPERRALLTRVGAGPGGSAAAGNAGMFVMPLAPKEERERSQAEILESVKKKLGGVTAFMAIPIQPATVGRGFGSPVQFVIQHPEFDELAAELPKFVGEMRKIEGLTAVNPDLKLNRPEVLLTIDRDRAASLGVPIRDVGRALQVLSGGRELTQFKKGSRQYPVIVQLARQDRATPDDLQAIQVRSRSGKMVPLSNLVKTVERGAAASRYHYDRAPSATISANLDGITLGEAIERVQAMADAELPDGFRTALAGESREFAESSAALGLVLLLAFVLVYLVLAAQFDSFSDPVSVLVGVPLALAGAFGSLWITGTTLSFFSQVGLILLVGLVTKNGILIVEYARQLEEEHPGMDPWTSAAQAARLRFRPILMTSVATIGGAVPIAVGFTSESRAPLGVVVVGGMLVSTVLSLYATPVAYAIVARLLRGRRKETAIAASVAAALLLLATPARAQDLTLEEALRMALRDNRDVQAAGWDVVAAEATVGQVRAGVLPAVTASGTTFKGFNPQFGAGSSGITLASARITVPLLDLAAVQDTVAAARRADAVEAGAALSVESVLYDVAARYVTLQRAEQAVAVAEANRARSARLAQLAEDRVEVELAPPIDRTRARLRLAQDEQALVAARSDREAARLYLGEVLGMQVGSEVTVAEAALFVDPTQLPSDEALDRTLAAALESHPSAVASEATVRAAEADRRAAYSGAVPAIDAYADNGVFHRWGEDYARTQQYGLTASWTLVGGGGRVAELRGSKAVLEAARLDAESADRAIEVEMRVALATLREAAIGVEVAESAVALAEEELRLAEERFAAGLTDNTAVVEAQARQAEVSRSRVDAIAAYNLSVVAWFSAQGRLRELAQAGA
jgi:multidrug efflux pump